MDGASHTNFERDATIVFGLAGAVKRKRTALWALVKEKPSRRPRQRTPPPGTWGLSLDVDPPRGREMGSTGTRRRRFRSRTRRGVRAPAAEARRPAWQGPLRRPARALAHGREPRTRRATLPGRDRTQLRRGLPCCPSAARGRAARPSDLKSVRPPLMTRTSYLWTASDPAYAAVNGSDSLPDLAFGRLPAENTDEAKIMIGKPAAAFLHHELPERLLPLPQPQLPGRGARPWQPHR
jgi:Peptidase family C25